MEKKQIKKINLNELKNVLSSKEMKNVKGGSALYCCAPDRENLQYPNGYPNLSKCYEWESSYGDCHSKCELANGNYCVQQ